MIIKQTREKGPVDRVSSKLDKNKYVVIPTDAIGCIAPKWHGEKISEEVRTDVVDLTVKIDEIKGAQKVLIVEE
jgi:hypothetical protein